MICFNKECGKDFKPKTHNQKYYSQRNLMISNIIKKELEAEKPEEVTFDKNLEYEQDADHAANGEGPRQAGWPFAA